LLHDAVVVARDDGLLPQTSAVLGFALSPLCRSGRLDVAAAFIGAMDRGAIAEVANFPGTADARARVLARVRAELGDEQTDVMVQRGATMSYDDLIASALEQLDVPND
jgi:hypothetical protein